MDEQLNQERFTGGRWATGTRTNNQDVGKMNGGEEGGGEEGEKEGGEKEGGNNKNSDVIIYVFVFFFILCFL